MLFIYYYFFFFKYKKNKKIKKIQHTGYKNTQKIKYKKYWDE